MKWSDAELIALSLPEAARGSAHEGSPAVFVRKKQFARLRWDDRQLLQFWVPDTDLVQAYQDSAPEIFHGLPGYSRKVVLGRLDRMTGGLVREVLVESWLCRAPMSLAAAHRGLR